MRSDVALVASQPAVQNFDNASFQSADLRLGFLPIVGLQACVDCSGNPRFRLRDYFLAVFNGTVWANSCIDPRF